MKITDFEAQLAINGFADVDGTRVVSHGVQGVTEAEARAYIADARALYPHETITVLEIRPCGRWQSSNRLYRAPAAV